MIIKERRAAICSDSIEMKKQMRKIINKLANYQVDGVGVVEIILILVILIGLVLIFKDQITDIVNDAFDAITQDATDIIS